MGDVFDRWRINQGWNPWDNKTQMAAIASFVHTLDAEAVPANAYSQLYERVLKSRVTAIQAGKQLPNFGVELMLAEWLGPYGLKTEWKQREIDGGRTLPSNAESVCQDCFGTGIKIIKDANGKTTGAAPGCKHEHTEQGERVMDFAQVEEVLVRPTPEDTAVDICSRVRQDLARMVVMLNGDESQRAWEASRTWAHAERYCRNNGENI